MRLTDRHRVILTAGTHGLVYISFNGYSVWTPPDRNNIRDLSVRVDHRTMGALFEQGLVDRIIGGRSAGNLAWRTNEAGRRALADGIERLKPGPAFFVPNDQSARIAELEAHVTELEQKLAMPGMGAHRRLSSSWHHLPCVTEARRCQRAKFILSCERSGRRTRCGR